MLLELVQAPVARLGLRIVGEKIAKLLDELVEGASAESVRSRWPPGCRPSLASVEAVAALDAGDLRALRDAVVADLGFDEKFGDPSFGFAFPGLSAAAKEAGGSLLESIYDVFRGSGGFRLDGMEVNRTTWERSFREANPQVEVCPACVSAPLPGPARDHSLVDADHYLPKTKYPALAVHGLNLVPMCKACNQSLKGSLDPLDDQGNALRLDEIWFPYRLAGLEEVALHFDIAAPASITLGGSPPALERAQRFEGLFALLERWSETLTSVAEGLPAVLLEAMEVDLDEASIRSGLEMLSRIAETEITREDRAFVKSRYYAWLLNTAQPFQALVAELQMLTEETSTHSSGR